MRALLSENDIGFYETSAGVLGFSMPALWLKDESQAEKAHQLLDEYQKQRQNNVREEYRLNQRTFMGMFKENPVRYLSIILAVILICFFMIFSFINF